LGGDLFLAALLWALMDIWPDENFPFTQAHWAGPIKDLTLALSIAFVE